MTKRMTIAELTEVVDALIETVDGHVTSLNDQIAGLEEDVAKMIDRVDTVEGSGDKRKRRGRNMTDEQRKEVGRRLQQARADKLGLETIQQLKELHLRPGTQPTKAEVKRVLKEFPAA